MCFTKQVTLKRQKQFIHYVQHNALQAVPDFPSFSVRLK